MIRTILNPTNIELLPIYLNGGTFIVTHLNSTDSLSKPSKIIFSADILWQITSFNTEQGIFSVEKGLNFYVWAVKRFIFNDPLPKDFSSVWYAPKRICHWIRKRRKLSMMKNNYKGYEDGFYIMVGVIYYHIVPDALEYHVTFIIF